MSAKLSLIIIVLFTVTNLCHAYFPNPAFWKRRILSLRFTTTAQTIFSGNCSGVTTVRTYSPEGALKNVTAPLTVTLTAPGTTTFYSDSNCTDQITSLTIATGTSTGSFYFVDSGTGAKSIVASATDYAAANQTETVNVNPYVWTGGGSDALWATGLNWSGGAAPGTTHRALFNETCSSNCSPIIAANVTVTGIRMTSGYTGTITQNAGVTVTVTSGGWSQQNGTFIGGNNTVTIAGLTLKGGTFTSTSGALSVSGTNVFSNSAVYNHNGGTFSTAGAVITTSGTLVLSKLEFHGWQDATVTGTINAADLKFVDYGYSNSLQGTNTINVYGNVELQGSRWSVATTSLIRMVGTGTISGTSGSRLGSLEIATAGTVTISPTSTLDLNGDLTYTFGTVISTGSTIRLLGNTQTITPGSMPFNNFSIITQDRGSVNVAVNGTMNIGGNLHLECTSYSATLNTGTLAVAGNVAIVGSQFKGGTALVKMVGTGTITGSGIGSALPGLEIDTAGTITFATTGSVDVQRYFKYTSGTVITTDSTVRFTGTSGVTFIPGTLRFNNLTLSLYTSASSTMTGTAYVDGNLSLVNASYGPSIDGGTFEVKGNLSNSNWYGGTSEIILKGTGVQTMTDGGSFPGTTLTVDSSSSVVTLGAAFTESTKGINVIAGSVNMAGFALTTKTLSLNSNTLTKNGGVLKVNGVTVGSGALYGGTVNP